MSYISDVTINGSNSPISASLRGNCSTASATAAKIVNCSDFDTLKEGVSIFVTFTNDNTASNPTLNVNSTGAKAIKNGSSTDIKWNAGTTVQFMYDEANWQAISSAGEGFEWGRITGDITAQEDLAEALDGGARFDTVQTKTDAEKKQAQDNIGVSDIISPLINQWDEQWEQGRLNPENGMELASTERVRSRYFELKPNTQYFAHSTVGLHILFFNSNKEYISAIQNVDNVIFITPANTKYARFCESVNSTGTYANNISINYPASYTGYYPSALPKAKAELEEAINTNGFGEKSGGRNLLNPDPSKRLKSNSYSYVYLAEGALRVRIEDNDTSVDLSGISFGFTKDIANANDAFVWIINNGVLGRGRNNIATNESGAGQRCPYIFVCPNTQITWEKIFQRYHIIVERGTGSEAGPYVPFFYSNKQLEVLPWADLLWENASPTSAFAAQTISVDLSKYSFVLAEFTRAGVYGDTHSVTTVIKKGKQGEMIAIESDTLAYRRVSVSEVGCSFEGGARINPYATKANANDILVPLRLYGIR